MVLAAISSILKQSPDFELYHCPETDFAAQRTISAADVILFDQSQLSPNQKASIRMYPAGIPMIGLDFDGSTIVAHLSQVNSLASPDDLKRVIQCIPSGGTGSRHSSKSD